MMKKLSIAATVAGAAAHTRSTFDAKEFVAVGKAAPSEVMTFSAALPASNMELLQARLDDISNPKSANYGRWLTKAEARELTAPPAEVRAEVAAWLASKGASCGDWPTSLRCSMTVAQLEAAFGTKVTEYNQVPTAKKVLRVAPEAPFTMPAELAGKLQFLTAITDFPSKRMRMGSGINAVKTMPALRGSKGAVRVGATDLIVTLETIDRMYQISAVQGSAAATQAPAEFQADQAILDSDISDFATAMGIQPWTITNKHGEFSGSDTEATLDGQYIAGVGQGNSNWWWTEDNWMYEWTEDLKAANETAQVYSVSWGWSEQDQCDVDQTGPCASGTSADYVTQTNAGFAAVTATGVSIAVSSGDSGAHGRTDGACQSKATLPDWPAASPYILSIGATQLQNGGTPITAPTTPYCKNPTQGACAGGGVEIVASPATGALIASGGGFSVYAPQPAWQKAAVATYLASGALLPTSAEFNSTNRAYPDVAALGHNVLIFQSGALPVDGTSCSAPMWGGVLALANANRLAAGKAVLGYANAAIYQVAASTPTAFTDVTVGDNTCTEDGCTPGCSGFGAAAGYDATTGWGTPVVPTLVKALAAL